MEKDYFPVSLDKVDALLSGESELLNNGFVLTFDDGYLCTYKNVFPILKEYDIPATSFIITSRVGMDGYMNWEQLKKLMESRLFTIESHTHNHTKYRIFKYHGAEIELVRDIETSIKLIKDKLGYRTLHFSYPYGRFSWSYIKTLKQLGFKTGLTLFPGSNNRNSNRFLLKRKKGGTVK